MRYLPPFEENIRAQIRNEMAMTPLITVMQIKERLEKHFPRGFDYTYIRRLVSKVRNEISYEIDSARIEPRLASIRENYRVMRERLLKILYWKPDDGGKPPANRDVNEAAKNIVMMDLADPTGRSRGRHVQEADRGTCTDHSLRAVAGRSARGCHRCMATWRAIANASN